ncbi:MAG: phosphoenolpyruvate carboxykinase (ATP) [bacterium]
MSGDFVGRLDALLQDHRDVLLNPGRGVLIIEAERRREAMVAACGALATWTPVESTGRSPKDTCIVRRPESEDTIDWDSPNNVPLDPETMAMVLDDALGTLAAKPRLYVTDRCLGADPAYALPIRTVTDRALTALFTDNMFRPLPGPGCGKDFATGLPQSRPLPGPGCGKDFVTGLPQSRPLPGPGRGKDFVTGLPQNRTVPADIGRSCFAARSFTLVVLPYDKLDPERYRGRLRVDPRLGHTSTMVIAMDMDRRLGVVYGSAYGGSVKKLGFTVMNYYLPAEGILPLHCAANESAGGDVALLLGLSGTGKTTLSADPRRALLGDDEHGWSDAGIANFEQGCYAKLINLRRDKEPEIWNACFHAAPAAEHGAIVENAMVYPDGRFDLDDERYTPNSRGSYPLSFLTNIKPLPVGGHPKTILFLTADANGVLPPVARLTREQAMLWFLMGYTSKLAGTETGIVEPKTTFSRFFGAPFMPRNPDVYAGLLGERLDRHGSRVFLVNTGWSGGPYGTGRRMDISLTREIVEAALAGGLDGVEYSEDGTFHLRVPKSCPGVADPGLLNPRGTWADPEAYDERARRLAAEFCAHFDRAYGAKRIAPGVARQCPGK